MEEAFYTKVNEFIAILDVKKQRKHLIRTELYNEAVEILGNAGGKHQPQLKFCVKILRFGKNR